MFWMVPTRSNICPWSENCWNRMNLDICIFPRGNIPKLCSPVFGHYDEFILLIVLRTFPVRRNRQFKLSPFIETTNKARSGVVHWTVDSRFSPGVCIMMNNAEVMTSAVVVNYFRVGPNVRGLNILCQCLVDFHVVAFPTPCWKGRRLRGEKATLPLIFTEGSGRPKRKSEGRDAMRRTSQPIVRLELSRFSVNELICGCKSDDVLRPF